MIDMTTSDPKTMQVLEQVFPNLDEAGRVSLAEAAVSELYAAQEIICYQGEVGNSLFVLAEGNAAVLVNAASDSMIQVNSVTAPNYFGEMALLVDDTERSATIQAITDCHVLTIDREAFQQVMDSNPTLLRRLAHQITEHMRNNDRMVISELRSKNQELAQTYAHLAAQEQMRREFVTTLSHELRTPLTSIQGFLQLINRGMLKGDSLPVALASITRNVEQLVGLTNNLLVLYEMQLTSPEYTDIVLADLLMSAMRKVQENLSTAVDNVAIEISPQMPIIRGDMAGLTLAVHALIENAIKFSQLDSPVTVRASMRGVDQVRIEVEDEGVGIPIGAQEKIFEPFYRLENRQPSHTHQLFAGVGIGLSIAKFIVEQHLGHIEVQSSENEGSLFTICIPIHGA
ncbi:MAG: cyclic nucleotide-binding domain-containing protein [Anaerolineales bacterium]|nr:cyclic nucleotide-binding domain-containing protein [Anaerolineales bacterium]